MTIGKRLRKTIKRSLTRLPGGKTRKSSRKRPCWHAKKIQGVVWSGRTAEKHHRTGIQPMEALVQRHLSKGNTFRLRVLGRSMVPLIRSGDILQIHAARDYSVGDILLYTRGNDWVAHRFVGIGKSGNQTDLVMRGDALALPDLPVSIDSVLGRVDGIERGGRHLRLDSFHGRACRALARIGFPWHRILSAACVLYNHVKQGRARFMRDA